MCSKALNNNSQVEELSISIILSVQKPGFVLWWSMTTKSVESKIVLLFIYVSQSCHIDAASREIIRSG
jgi:hypothetical protein